MKTKILMLFCYTFLNMSLCNAQVNILTSSEANNVKINGVNLSDLSNTNGNTGQVQLLLNENFSVTQGEGESFWKNFVLGSNRFYFKDPISNSQASSVYRLNMVSIKDDNFPVTVKGTQIRIGDQENIFNDNTLVFVTNTDGTKSFYFSIINGVSVEFITGPDPTSQNGQCIGTQWNTTTGYYTDEGQANGDCEDNDPVVQCGDGTYACTEAECTPISYPVNCSTNASKSECEASNGCNWVVNNIILEILIYTN